MHFPNVYTDWLCPTNGHHVWSSSRTPDTRLGASVNLEMPASMVDGIHPRSNVFVVNGCANSHPRLRYYGQNAKQGRLKKQHCSSYSCQAFQSDIRSGEQYVILIWRYSLMFRRCLKLY